MYVALCGGDDDFLSYWLFAQECLLTSPSAMYAAGVEWDGVMFSGFQLVVSGFAR
jgi:hypothetical protein